MIPAYVTPAEEPEPERVEADREADRLSRVAEQPDSEQVERDWEADRLSRIAPETLAWQKKQEEIRQHAELIKAIQAAEAQKEVTDNG